MERAQGERLNDASWVRTAYGWEHSTVLQSRPAEQGSLHPLVVAGLQLGGSVLVLLAFPRHAAKPALLRQRTFWPTGH